MIAILKYNAGNTQSVVNAVNRLGYECFVTNDVNEIERADKVIFPGVGEAASAMAHLKTNGLDTIIRSLEQPILGICLGMQLMCRFTEEGNTNGLDIFDVEVKKFPSVDIVPHMGWNSIDADGADIFSNINTNNNFYFVHSYYAELNKYTIAECDYILPFSAALKKDNFYGVQFHPEKSGSAGERLLKNFLDL